MPDLGDKRVALPAQKKWVNEVPNATDVHRIAIRKKTQRHLVK